MVCPSSISAHACSETGGRPGGVDSRHFQGRVAVRLRLIVTRLPESQSPRASGGAAFPFSLFPFPSVQFPSFPCLLALSLAYLDRSSPTPQTHPVCLFSILLNHVQTATATSCGQSFLLLPLIRPSCSSHCSHSFYCYFLLTLSIL